jgi:hypothetical protein
MMSTSCKQYALVEWIAGKDAGTFTTIEADWIRESNQIDVKAGRLKDGVRIFDNPLDVVVEWRVGKKSKEGYALCEAKLLELSRK